MYTYRGLVRITLGCVYAPVFYNVAKAGVHRSSVATMISELLRAIHQVLFYSKSNI